jgi:hypothetical protein
MSRDLWTRLSFDSPLAQPIERRRLAATHPGRALGALLWLAASLAACSGARAGEAAAPADPIAEPEPETSSAPGPAASEPALVGEQTKRAGVGDEPPPAATPEPERPTACPEAMVLVEGDYCSEVEHKCVKHWHSKANDKTVCEEFEPWSKCVGSKAPKRFCIDTYSWPNRSGERPEVMNNFYQAQVKCAAVGKRLCTESEWTMSCEGPELKPFPYGYVRDTAKCNGDREWDHPKMNRVAKRDPTELARLWQGVRSGAQPQCVSDYGVHDLPGNNDEVVSSETHSTNYKGKYDSVHTGGPWYLGVRNQCRPKIYTHNEGFYYYFLGFRCCAEPDGALTDPRAPKQIERGWDFERIERLARFSTAEMKAKLDLKAKGECTCGEKETLCKTMCGTLLGPGAKDAVLGESR